MSSTVNSLLTSTGNNCDGNITLTSTVPSILAISNTPTSPYTINFAPVASTVATFQGKNGNVTLAPQNGMGSVTTTAIGSTVSLLPYAPATGTATSATTVAQNLSNAMAWQGSGTPAVSTVAYVPGAMVINGGSTFVCLVAQPIGSAVPVSGANWQSIGGGGSSGNTITGGTAPNVGTLSVDATTGNIELLTTGTSTQTFTSSAITDITGSELNLTGGPQNIVMSAPNGIGINATNILNLTVSSGIIEINTQSGNSGPALSIGPSQGDSNYVSGGALYNCGAFDSTAGYGVASVVQEGSVSYVALNNVAPNNTAPYNPLPSTDPTDWLPLDGSTTASSISANGALVACDDPSGSGAIVISTSTGAEIKLDTSLTPINGDIKMVSGASFTVDTTADANGGVSLKTSGTQSYFGQYGGSGLPGQIQLTSADATNPAKVSIGGAVDTTGLYISNTQVLFNNVPLGGGGGGMTLSQDDWSPVLNYPAQTLLNDPAQGSFVAPLAVASGGTTPWTGGGDTGGWNNLTYGYSYYYGAWDAVTTYPMGAIVTFDGIFFQCIVDSLPVNRSPILYPNDWTFLSGTTISLCRATTNAVMDAPGVWGTPNDGKLLPANAPLVIACNLIGTNAGDAQFPSNGGDVNVTTTATPIYFWSQNLPTFPDNGNAVYNFIPGLKYRVTGALSYQASSSYPFTLQILLTSTILTIDPNFQYNEGLLVNSSQSIVQTYFNTPGVPIQGLAPFDWVFTAPIYGDLNTLGCVITFGFTPATVTTGLIQDTRIITAFQTTANNIVSPSFNPTAFGIYTTPGLTVTCLGT